MNTKPAVGQIVSVRLCRRFHPAMGENTVPAQYRDADLIVTKHDEELPDLICAIEIEADGTTRAPAVYYWPALQLLADAMLAARKQGGAE